MLFAAPEAEVADTYASSFVADVGMLEVPYAVVQTHPRRQEFRDESKIPVRLPIGFPRWKCEPCKGADLTVKGVVESLSPVDIGSNAAVCGLFHGQLPLKATVAHALCGFCEEAETAVVMKGKQGELRNIELSERTLRCNHRKGQRLATMTDVPVCIERPLLPDIEPCNAA